MPRAVISAFIPLLLLALLTTCALAITVDELVSAPVVDPAVRPISDSYRVLLTRSIFSKDHNRPATLVKSSPTTRPDSSNSDASESSFVLNGVAIEDEVVTAFFEQTADHIVVRARKGEPIARGTIGAITLDGVDYVHEGRASHVSIGQTLDGGTAVVAAAPSGASAAPVTEHPSGEKPSWWRKKSSDDSSSSKSGSPEKKKKHRKSDSPE